MSEGRPQLKAVSSSDAPPEAPATPRTGGSGSRLRQALPWLLALGLLGAALGWAGEARESGRLADELARTSAALEAARGEIAAYESHVGQARERARALIGQAAGLADRLAELEAWLATGPGEAADASAGAGAPSEGAPAAQAPSADAPGDAPATR